jgi:hypothetical protein
MAAKSSMGEKRLMTLAKKTAEQKLSVLEQLAKCCIIQLACERVGVGRSTYYKWLSEDKEFKELAEKAFEIGRAYLNDIAFSGLLKKIQEGDLTMLIFWLKNNHPWFAQKIRHEHEHLVIGVGDGILTEEQREQLVDALRRSGRFSAQESHKILSREFLKELYPDSPKSDPKDSDPSTSPPNEISAPLPPKEEQRNGVNIADFLKNRKKK